MNFSNRGALLSVSAFSAQIGILVAFVLGTFCHFYTTPKLSIGLTIVFAVLITFIPESPYYLIQINEIMVSEFNVIFLTLISH